MTEPMNEMIPFTDGDWFAGADTKAKPLADVAQEYGIVAPHQKAEALRGQSFTILGLKKVASDLPGPGYYYFVACYDAKAKEYFTTSLGGQAVLQTLDRMIAKGVKEPVVVTLDFVEQGAFDGYYVLR